MFKVNNKDTKMTSMTVSHKFRGYINRLVAWNRLSD